MRKRGTLRACAGGRPALGRTRCEDCGRPIPVKRLRANPFAARCFECQDAIEHPPHEQTVHDSCPVCGHGLMWKPIGSRPFGGYRLVCTRFPECGFNGIATAS